jgi:phage terminase Nu1 subunit (DNA packaging protein)
MDWLKKSWSEMLDRDPTVYAAMKLCIGIIEDSKYLSKAELLNKYEYRFKELSDKIIDVVNEDILGLYSISSYTAHITNCQELKSIMAEVYKSLKSKYPEVFKTALDKIKNAEDKVKNTGEEAEIKMGFAA